MPRIVDKPGAHTIAGTTRDDEILGRDGADILYGMAGNDSLFGGFGRDGAPDPSDDQLYGGPAMTVSPAKPATTR